MSCERPQCNLTLRSAPAQKVPSTLLLNRTHRTSVCLVKLVMATMRAASSSFPAWTAGLDKR